MMKVLVVEDEASIREMIALNLRLAGMEPLEAESAEAALALLETKPGCVAAILDERATPGQRYHAAMLRALPKMPVTSDLHAVEAFLRRVKDKTYWK